MSETKSFNVSWETLWKITTFAVLIAILYQGRQILLGLFLAIIISSGLETIVDFLEKRGVPRTLGVILIFLLSLVIIIFVIYALVPLVIVDLNTAFSGLDRSNPFLGSLINIGASQESLGVALNKISSGLFSGNISPFGFLSQTVGSVGLAVAVLVSSFYLSLSRDGVERFIKTVLPATYEKMALKIYERSRRKIGAWFQTQILLSVIMGFLVWGALALLGVKHAFLLGILAGFFEIVPFVGPILAGAISVLVALSVSFSLAIYTLITFLALQQFESNALVPILMRRTVGLHPVIVIVAILIGTEVGGFLGLLIAVPAAAVFEEAIGEWSGKKGGTEEVLV
ncbi:MAG: AI-2E family transporter [Patescibacteria group bacterium]|nr:AI-2E family transporter [Patescibacteria group bacterium]MDE2015425.1 AI-2E family transporter [Patescibacteria group bacterium]MDE2226960.1 AI-2E family transporter [Patescibacteria group bacterium]